jgi:hypothetical protein
LSFNQGFIGTVLLDELVMRATLQDLASLEHDDFIGILDGRESMSDDDYCLTELAIGKDAIQSLLD